LRCKYACSPSFARTRQLPRRARTYNVSVKVAVTPRSAMATSHIFRIMFVNQGKIYEVYARKVSHGELFGFIEVEELLFGERSSVVLDPGEERIKGEFSGVKRTFLPMHSILRIDEVRKHGPAKITVLESGANVAQFPMPIYSTPPGEKK
jgi:hypothetical protein